MKREVKNGLLGFEGFDKNRALKGLFKRELERSERLHENGGLKAALLLNVVAPDRVGLNGSRVMELVLALVPLINFAAKSKAAAASSAVSYVPSPRLFLVIGTVIVALKRPDTHFLTPMYFLEDDFKFP